MPWDGTTGTVTLEVESVSPVKPDGTLDVWVRNIVGVDIIAGGFPVRVAGVEVEPVPDSRGHLDVSWDSVMDPDILRYEYSLKYQHEEEYGEPVQVGNVTSARVAVLPQVLVEVRVRAVNDSGPGEWSFPVPGQGGFIDGVEAGYWGALTVRVNEPTWTEDEPPPPPEPGWGILAVRISNEVTWS